MSKYPGYFYLASPYTRYPGGLDAACEAVCRQAALLMREGVFVLSPIAHSHPIAMHGRLDAVDHDFWLRQDEVLMRGSIGMIDLMLEGWEDSYGMEWERRWFRQQGKPVIPMLPGCVPADLSLWQAEAV